MGQYVYEKVLLVILCLGLCGCIASTEVRYQQTDQLGVEKMYNYPYNKVFYACEDALPRMAWTIQESNFNKGNIFSRGAFDYSTESMGILVKEIGERKVSVKVLGFGPWIPKSAVYTVFFNNVEALLSRK